MMLPVAFALPTSKRDCLSHYITNIKKYISTANSSTYILFSVFYFLRHLPFKMSKITPANQFQNRNVESLNNSAGKPLEQEIFEHKVLADRRWKLFEDILNNRKSIYEKSTFTSVMISLIGGIIFNYVVLCFLTLVPMTIQEYIPSLQWWWEHPLHTPLLAGYIINDCSYWMNITSFKNTKAFFILLFVGNFAFAAVLGSMYLIWSLFGFAYPVPFAGIVGGYTIAFGQYFGLWLVFPESWRKDGEFRKRLFFFIVAVTWSQVPVVQYTLIGAGMVYLDPSYQWIVAILLAVLRHFNTTVLMKLASFAAQGDIKRMEIPCSHMMNTRHALFLTYTIGSIGTLISAAIFLTTDFLINMYITFQILKVKKNDKNSIKETTELLQDLIVNEMVEFITPIMYLLCFVTAFYGPNANLIGNISNSKWHFVAVEDLGQSVTLICLFFCLDAVSAVISTGLLWKFRQINLYRVLAAIQMEFGFVFTLNFTCIFYFVSFLKRILSRVIMVSNFLMIYNIFFLYL